MNLYPSGHHAFAAGTRRRIKLDIANAFARAVAMSRSPDRLASAATARRSVA